MTLTSSFGHGLFRSGSGAILPSFYREVVNNNIIHSYLGVFVKLFGIISNSEQ